MSELDSLYKLKLFYSNLGNVSQSVSELVTKVVNLIDVTLACEDANSKLVDVVTVADEDHVGNNLLQISKLWFGQKANLLFRL